MKHDLKKATLIPAVAAKNRDAANLTRHFHGGSPSSPYTKRQSPTLFISKSHPSHFCTKLEQNLK